MKLLSVSDLHFNRALFAGLDRAVAKHNPDILAVVGDTAAFFEPPKGVLDPTEAARLLAETAGKRPVVFVRGNHDREDPWRQFWSHRRHTWVLLEGSGCDIFGVGFVGFPSEYNSDTLDLLEWRAWLLKLPVSQQRGVWLMHEPPTDEIADWQCVASRWRYPIRRFAPVLTLSGHDHSTSLRTCRWRAHVGDSVVVCAGQGNARLRYIVADIDPRPGAAPVLRSVERFVA
ncbi:MAG: metallophosphoesterase [Chthoniobacteraceae bacterium]